MIGRYVFAGKLGEGSYGKVKEAIDSHTCRRVAVKIMQVWFGLVWFGMAIPYRSQNRKLRKIPSGQDNAKTEIRLLRVCMYVC